jgi:hypothetical protein
MDADAMEATGRHVEITGDITQIRSSILWLVKSNSSNILVAILCKLYPFN